MKTFQTAHDGDTLLKIDSTHIEIDSHGQEVDFTPTEDDRLHIALALLGDAPPLDEAYGSPEEIASDISQSDGEIRYRAIAALEALSIRREIILRKTRERQERDAKIQAEAKHRLRQIQLLEEAYLSTQPNRAKRTRTQASQNIAAAFYEAGMRVTDPDEEEETTEA
jgi:2'-5' RNA ligase